MAIVTQIDDHFGNMDLYIIENMCEKMIEIEDYDGFHNFMKTYERYDKICQEVWDRELAKAVNKQPTIDLIDGTKKWYKYGEHHRDGDKPAKILADGQQEWYKYGEHHRDGDKPAKILADGTQ